MQFLYSCSRAVLTCLGALGPLADGAPCRDAKGAVFDFTKNGGRRLASTEGARIEVPQAPGDGYGEEVSPPQTTRVSGPGGAS